MTFERFKELWDKAGLNNPPKFDNPTCVDEMSQRTVDALLAAAVGDFTEFEKITTVLNDGKDSASNT
jgi:hypothetical protein